MRRRDVLSLRFLTHVLLLRPLLWAIFGINIRGRENLKSLGQFILVSNHNSHLDTLLIFSALPVRQILNTRVVAASDYFAKHPRLFRVVEFLFDPIWVDREGAGGTALPRIQAAVDAGRSVVLFPEGTRGEAGTLGSFRTGIGRLVEANRAIPVVPVFLEGPERALPRQASFPLPLWNHLTIAPPQLLEGDCHRVTYSLRAALDSLNEQARQARQRRPARPNVFTVAVLGVDGSGKSTLSRRLAEVFSTADRTCVIGDHLELFCGAGREDVQPLLTERFRRRIAAQAKRAGSLARYRLPKLVEILLRERLRNEAARWYRPSWIFMDGMPALNLSAWAILYGEEHFSPEVCNKLLAILTGCREAVGRHDPVFAQFPELAHLERLHLDRMRVPDVTVFLDVPPEVCVKRIESRGELRQVHETEEHLAKLRQAYLLVCSVLKDEWKLPVLVLDGCREPDVVATEAESFVRRSCDLREASDDD